MNTVTIPSLRSPQNRVGILAHADLPPPEPRSQGDPFEAASTEQLLRLALVDGDEEAFRSVVSALWPQMLETASEHVRSTDDAQDVVQDTWVAALRGIHRFEGRSALLTWLFRILRNRARTAGTRASRTVPVSQLEPAETSTTLTLEELASEHLPTMGTPALDPEEAEAVAGLRRLLEEALSELPARQRSVFVQRDLEGRSAQETARKMGLTSGNERVLLHRARTKLRELITDRWMEEP
jgi:RNA polymerase sigma-70 factor, ECF subfamily